MNDRIFEESLRKSRARINRELFVGRGRHTGRLYYLDPDKYLATHMHISGASNFGKSYYMEHLLRAYAELGISASVIDPHGDTAKHFYESIQHNYRLTRTGKVIHFKPGSRSSDAGFDPFRCGLKSPDEVASLVLEAFMKVWGAQTFNETPRLERVLRIMFHVFAANKLPLTESYQFLSTANRSFREQLLSSVPDEAVRSNWQEIERLPRSERAERLESSWNRLQRFLSVRAVAELFAAQERSLNVAEMFNRGQILVADLSLLHSTESQSLVGTMLVNALYHAAKRRPEGRRRHWVLALDEFPQFVTTDVGRSLDELRKFGIRLMLAHQHLSQLPEDLLASVMTNAKIRIAFGGHWRPDAEILARELFSGEVRGEYVKHVTYQTKFRPYLVETEIETSSESATEGASVSDGWSDGSSYGSGETEGESVTDETVTQTLSSGYSSAETRGRSGSFSNSRSTTRGKSRSSAFVTEHEEFTEETGRQFWPLEEQWEKLIARIMRLDRREALIKAFNRPVIDIETPEIMHESEWRRQKRQRKQMLVASNGGIKSDKAKDAETPNESLPQDFRE